MSSFWAVFGNDGDAPKGSGRPWLDWVIGTTIVVSLFAIGMWAWVTTVQVPVLALLVLVALALIGAGATARTAVLRVIGATRPNKPARSERPDAPRTTDPPVTAHQAITGDPEELVGDADRDAVLYFLNQRYGSGHLGADEHEQRHTQALNAANRGDLQNACRKLRTGPVDQDGTSDTERRAEQILRHLREQ